MDHRSQNPMVTMDHSLPVHLQNTQFNAKNQHVVKRTQCGNYDECMESLEGSFFKCNNCFGGPFCKYSPAEEYAVDEFIPWLENGTLPDSSYYQHFWSDIDDPWTRCNSAFPGDRRRRNF
jgi:hypothetical protein